MTWIAMNQAKFNL